MTTSAQARNGRDGFTLVELMVVLIVLAILAAVSALGNLQTRREVEHPALAALSSARARAERLGQAVTIHDTLNGRPVHATALADGRVIVDAALLRMLERKAGGAR